MYKLLVRPFLFFFDPEKIHHFSFRFLKTAAPLGGIMRGLYSHHDSSLETQCFGLTFKNPVGLAAGFDKDALIAEKWQNLGFGFVKKLENKTYNILALNFQMCNPIIF